MNEKMNGGISTTRGIFCRLPFQKWGITAEAIAAQGFDSGIFSAVIRQTMIIRTTFSKWVMCSDLSFLLRIFCKSKGGNEKSCPCFFCIMQLYLTCVKKVNDLFSAIKAGELNWISTKILLSRDAMPSMPGCPMKPSQG